MAIAATVAVSLGAGAAVSFAQNGSGTAADDSAARELVVNGSFEAGQDGWKIKSPGVLDTVTDGRSGEALRIGTESRSTVALNDVTNVAPQTAADSSFQVSAWVRTTTPDVTGQLRVREVLDGELVGQGDSYVSLHDTDWHQLSFDYATEVEGSTLDLNLVVWQLPAASSLVVDDISMTTAAPSVTEEPVATASPSTTQAPASPTTTATETNAATSSSTVSATTATTTTTAQADTECTLSDKLVPSCGALWGMYTRKTADNWVTPYTDLEDDIGRTFDIVKRYHDWSNKGANGQFPDADEQELGADGNRILFFAWVSNTWSSGGNATWKDIADGKYDDSVIIPEAARLKAWGQKFFLTYDHEMDGVTRTSFGTTDEYVAAYRHIHDVLKAQGVDNVVWVWNPTGYLGNEDRIASMYPGDAYVDWVAYDPYNFHLCHNTSWRDTKTVLNSFYTWAENNGLGDKPFMLAEFGSSFDPNNASAMGDWYADMVPALKALPNIKAAVHFNSGNGKKYCDYRITTNEQSMEGFSEAGLDPYLTPLG